METTKIDRTKITDAITAMRGSSPSDILDAVSQLTETERMVVSIVLDLATAPAKAKRGRPAGSQNRKVAAITESKAS